MNKFGEKLTVELFGATHEPSVGVVIKGVPPQLAVTAEDMMPDILRRKSGAPGTTPRIEDDIPLIEDSRSKEGILRISFENKNIRPGDYSLFKDIPRPGHADFTASRKYGEEVPGWFSGRMTLPLVAAGAVAKKMVAPVSVAARLVSVGGVPYDNAAAVSAAILSASVAGDSLGGIIECVCTGVPVGVGEPFFDSLESMISHAVFSIPGIRGIEFGDGFACTSMKGSEHNDPIVDGSGRTSRNGAGGINGGISNGNPIVFRVAVKPTSSIRKEQMTWDFASRQIVPLEIPGRHDVCFALRVPPVVEAVTAIVLANYL